MTKIELVGYDFCPFIQPSITTLKEKGLAHVVTYLDPDDKPDWLIEVSPMGATPFLRADGQVLFESAVMNEFANDVSHGDLHPKDAILKAQNRMWISRSYTLLEDIYALKTTREESDFAGAKKRLRAKLDLLNDVLGDNPFFNGNTFCLIDGAFAPVLRSIDILDRHFALGLVDGFANVERWSNTVLSRASVQATVVETYEAKTVDRVRNSQAVLSRHHTTGSPAQQRLS